MKMRLLADLVTLTCLQHSFDKLKKLKLKEIQRRIIIKSLSVNSIITCHTEFSYPIGTICNVTTNEKTKKKKPFFPLYFSLFVFPFCLFILLSFCRSSFLSALLAWLRAIKTDVIAIEFFTSSIFVNVWMVKQNKKVKRNGIIYGGHYSSDVGKVYIVNPMPKKNKIRFQITIVCNSRQTSNYNYCYSNHEKFSEYYSVINTPTKNKTKQKIALFMYNWCKVSGLRFNSVKTSFIV